MIDKTREEPNSIPIEHSPKMPEDNTEKQQDNVDETTLQNVAERLKFFFSDANVRQDFFVRKFLMTSPDGDNKANDDDADAKCSPGTVPIEVLLRFNTIKKYTTDPAVIVRAIKEKLSEKLVLKDDDKSVGRVKPFTKELMSDNIPVSFYIKNLPTKEEENDHGKKIVQYATSVDELRKFFDPYGDVALVRLRYKKSARSDDDNHTDDIQYKDGNNGNNNNNNNNKNKQPRRRYPLGACIVEFDNKEDYEKAAAEVLTLKDGEKVDAKKKLEVGGNTLELMSLQDYIDNLKKTHSRKRERDEGDEGDDDEGAEEKDQADSLEKIDFKMDWKPNCVIRLKGLAENCDREAILDAVASAMGTTVEEVSGKKKVRADFSRGQTDGAIRFEEPDDVVGDVVKKLKDGDVKIAGAKVEEAFLLEGDEEKKYWDDFIEFRKKQILHRNQERGSNKHRQKRRKGRANNRRNS